MELKQQRTVAALRTSGKPKSYKTMIGLSYQQSGCTVSWSRSCDRGCRLRCRSAIFDKTRQFGLNWFQKWSSDLHLLEFVHSFSVVPDLNARVHFLFYWRVRNQSSCSSSCRTSVDKSLNSLHKKMLTWSTRMYLTCHHIWAKGCVRPSASCRVHHFFSCTSKRLCFGELTLTFKQADWG